MVRGSIGFIDPSIFTGRAILGKMGRQERLYRVVLHHLAVCLPTVDQTAVFLSCTKDLAGVHRNRHEGHEARTIRFFSS